jgi:NAD(P)-dependent dehydrogenase (short-subunit alcohol dehydrogenase family)
MSMTIPFGPRSTADQVLAGVDLTGRRILVTGCSSAIGLATMNALAANGAHVVGLARSLMRAKSACEAAGPSCTPVECDLADLQSVSAAAQAVLAQESPLDAIIANAALACPQTLQTRNGVELQFMVNHIGHFALVNRLLGMVRNVTGRIVVVSSSASIKQAPPEGIMFDNLDGHQWYDPLKFYAQSKLAVAVYAKELARRLLSRGVTVNSLHPGATKVTQLFGRLAAPLRIIQWAARPFMKSHSQAAATEALLAASPRVTGVSGEYWSDCQIANGHPLLDDSGLAARLWQVSEQIVAAHASSPSSLQAAA